LARLATELDGGEYLDSSQAYRRNDMLPQQHGYFVLRFLAEDVGKHLVAVLDAILLALSRRGANERNECSCQEHRGVQSGIRG
jgi:very-short-patch-repair endonuclease